MAIDPQQSALDAHPASYRSPLQPSRAADCGSSRAGVGARTRDFGNTAKRSPWQYCAKFAQRALAPARLVTLIVAGVTPLAAQVRPGTDPAITSQRATRIADSLVALMTLDEKLGQL